MRLSRRRFLALSGAAIAGRALGSSGLNPRQAHGAVGGGPPPTKAQREALAVLGKTTLRGPGSRYDPSRAAGADLLPGIESIVVLMMENHSFDNLFGMLGRGDGFTRGAGGKATASNPYANGDLQEAFHMPTTCQLGNQPTQEWEADHIQYANGANDGFVISGSGPVAMGYWTGADLPFTYSLASRFPIGDRWFCSVLGQTYPNRMYLIAATSMGRTDDFAEETASTLTQPPRGTIFDALSDHGISWTNYVSDYPSGATPLLYSRDDAAVERYQPFARFYTDAAAGRLPSVSLLDPDYDVNSQENPQNIVVGEALLARVVGAIGSSPQWLGTLFVLVYDEHGGYFDHVPPPIALPPDRVAPIVRPGERTYDGFARYGFRVPSVVVSPYAKTSHVSSVVHDHTSILAMIERKWNLPALTYRDANANDLTDFLDLDALAVKEPTFPKLPPLARAGDAPSALACSVRGPGTIPPAGSVIRRGRRNDERGGAGEP